MEIYSLHQSTEQTSSLLSWERGLKFWIFAVTIRGKRVAPLVGAWIEISSCILSYLSEPSLLSWERGLKFDFVDAQPTAFDVAPLVGAWIEITLGPMKTEYRTSLLSWERGLKCITHWYENNGIGRSSRGSVD